MRGLFSLKQGSAVATTLAKATSNTVQPLHQQDLLYLMGAAVRELISTWREAAPADAPVELLVLLGGAPNLGAGALAPRAPPPPAALGAGGPERDDDDGADRLEPRAVAAWELPGLDEEAMAQLMGGTAQRLFGF